MRLFRNFKFTTHAMQYTKRTAHTNERYFIFKFIKQSISEEKNIKGYLLEN